MAPTSLMLSLKGDRQAMTAGNAARDRRDWTAAAAYYQRYLLTQPTHFAIWVQLGHVLKEAGQRVESLVAYSRALALDDTDADLLLSLGHLHKLMGHRDLAIDYYRRSAHTDNNPHALNELRGLGVTIDVAAPPTPSAAPRAPTPPVLPRTMARLRALARRKSKRILGLANQARDRLDWPMAARQYRLYLKERPEDFAIWVQLGHALKECGRLDEALGAYGQALAINSTDADLLLNLGHLHKQMGNVERAISLYQQSSASHDDVRGLNELHRLESVRALALQRDHGSENPGLNAPAAADVFRQAWNAISSNFSLSPAPLVSIIITNMNGARHLPALFESIRNQVYGNFEIIFVDDSSTDDSANIAKSLGAHKVIVTGQNVGFAKANNIGLAESSGELIAVLNNDTIVDVNWLDALVRTIKSDNSICAVAPKIRFWQKFQAVIISADDDFSIDRQELMKTLEYKKLFTRRGVETNDLIHSVQEGESSIIELHIPIQDERIGLFVITDVRQYVSVLVNKKKSIFAIDRGRTSANFKFTDYAKRSGFFIINNAGSSERDPLKPVDRGFSEIDNGSFDANVELDLFCGCSVLIRRDALHGRQLFIDEFVAYYEDSELSKWLKMRGYTIKYCPQSIVYHKHSATNIERSPFWLYQTSRNSFLFEYVFSDAILRNNLILEKKSSLNHIMNYYQSKPGATNSELEFAKNIPRLYTDIDHITKLIDEGRVPRRAATRIGLYNSYWNTMGGGEAHALDIAKIFSDYGLVELISEEDFDISAICKYFNIPVDKAIKRLVIHADTALTTDYDIFINSTYQSELVSKAALSYFVVSFPSKTPSREFLESYYFLANSEYTMSWMETYWGRDNFLGEVVYPAIPNEIMLDTKNAAPAKKKIILSVGRFASGGHTKNQMEIVQAFKKLNEQYYSLSKDYMLVLAGSANDKKYISSIKDLIGESNIVIIPDADFSKIKELYHDASIYVHASGFGRDINTNPELFEHFGMAVAQALGSGCYPIVFDAAGPREIVRKAGVGLLFHSVLDLTLALRDAIQLISSTDSEGRIKEHVNKASLFSSEYQRLQLKRIIDYTRRGPCDVK